MKHPFIFEPEKCIETILYIINKLPMADIHRISKIMYFADKAHLEKFKCFICGDHYMAMKHGPVPGCTFNILKAVQGDNSILATHIVKMANSALTVQDNFIVKPQREAHLEEFSKHEVACLNTAINQYGALSFQTLSELSCEAPWQATTRNDCINIEHIVALFPNASSLLKNLNIVSRMLD
ncbi:MAG: hypothetical protein DRQ49_12860 [Gammaproteobacteria bacterium]|nr:MAG: hypothetical protein DRQ49_12860 [Gammaproteobacteria bacterium]RKZ39167.1 MAG: hypothetical protein DRQ41_10960 [Gammaproteobacteria bacterium]